MRASAEIASASHDSEPKTATTAGPAVSAAQGSGGGAAALALPGTIPAVGLLHRSAVSQSANAPIRIAAFRQTQQTHGNRVAQRAIASASRSPAAPARLLQRSPLKPGAPIETGAADSVNERHAEAVARHATGESSASPNAA